MIDTFKLSVRFPLNKMIAFINKIDHSPVLIYGTVQALTVQCGRWRNRRKRKNKIHESSVLF